LIPIVSPSHLNELPKIRRFGLGSANDKQYEQPNPDFEKAAKARGAVLPSHYH